MLADFRYAVRGMRARPVFTAVVAVTLALGIGANTAIFSMIYAVLLRPFPYRQPDQLVRVRSLYTKTTGNVGNNSLPDIEDWRAQSSTFQALAPFISFFTNLTGDGPGMQVRATWVTPDLFPMLGVQAVHGRIFLPGEGAKPGVDAYKVLLSYALWQSRYGGDRAILGRTIRLREAAYEVVGVMPPGFRFPDSADLWAPLYSWYGLGDDDAGAKYRGWRQFLCLGRLKPGIAIENARADLDTISSRLESAYPVANRGVRPAIVTLRDAEAGNIRPYLRLLLGAVGCVLLICCTNVANLLLARAASREREIAVRAALGAGRAALARQMLVESVTLGLLGGLLGAGLAGAGVKALVSLIPDFEIPFWMRIEVDATVLAFNAGISLLTGVLFGLAPAARAFAGELSESLKEGSKGSQGGPRLRYLRDGLVVAEVAFCCILLAGAGLMIRTFLNLRRVDTGFRSDHVLTAFVSPYRYGSNIVEVTQRYASLYRRILDKLETTPGVEAVGGATNLPYLGQDRSRWEVRIKGQSDQEVSRQPRASSFDISAGFLRAMGIPLLQGRNFTEGDVRGAPFVTIVSQRAAKTLWPDQDAIGRQIKFGTSTGSTPWVTVVGVVGDIRTSADEADGGVEFYFPYTQWTAGKFLFAIRAKGDPLALASAVRAAVAAVDPNTAVNRIRTMDAIVGESIWQRRLWGVLFAIFGALALALGAVGIYGVMSYAVSLRTREIGIRMALGAQRGDVLGMVVGHALKLALIGAVVGVAAALAATRSIAGLLYGVQAADPLTFAAVPALLLVVALVAGYLPARRAATVDPLHALRHE